jgi:hypothetical protein
MQACRSLYELIRAYRQELICRRIGGASSHIYTFITVHAPTGHVPGQSRRPWIHVTQSRDQPKVHVTQSRDQPKVHVTQSRDQPKVHVTQSRDQPTVHVTSVTSLRCDGRLDLRRDTRPWHTVQPARHTRRYTWPARQAYQGPAIVCSCGQAYQGPCHRVLVWSGLSGTLPCATLGTLDTRRFSA